MVLLIKHKRWIAILVALLSAAILVGVSNLQNYKIIGVSLSWIAAILLVYVAWLIYKKEV